MASVGFKPEGDETKRIAVIRFGRYELRPSTGELRKAGVRIKLQDQPLTILQVLLDRRGDLVTREELRQALWSTDTFVEVDAGLNTAVMKLRQGLMDTAESPRYIETVPRQGYRFIAPVEIEYEGGPGTPQAEANSPKPAEAAWARWPWIAATVLSVLVAIAAVVWASVRRPEPEAQAPIRFQMDGPPGRLLARGFGRMVVITPAGDEVILLAQKGSVRQLFRRKLGELQWVAIPGTEGAVSPGLSDDGKWLTFAADGKLRAVSLDGREYREVLPLESPEAVVVWAAEGMYVSRSVHELRRTLPSPIFYLPGGNRAPERLTRPIMHYDGPEWQYVEQKLGDRLLFTAVTSPTERSAAAVSLKDRSTRVIQEHAMGARYVPTGHLVWYWTGNLYAARFDPESLRVRGVPVAVVTGVDRDGWRGAQAAISNNGTLVYVPGEAYEPKAVVEVDRNGVERTLLPAGPYAPLDLSPDGSRLLLAKHDAGGLDWTLWTYDLASAVWRRIFDGSGGTTNAVWSPDGQSVIGSSDHYGGRFSNLYEISAAGANERRITHNEHYGQYAQSWSAKAGAVAFAEGVHADTGVDIWVMPLQGDGKAVPFLNSADSEMNPAFSPDGKWLAYTRSGPSGVTVRIRAYPVGGPGISLEPGSAGPVWSHDGREIYYRLGRAMKAAGFANGRAGEARKLFEGSYAGPETWNVNAVLTRDGKFVLMKYAEQNPADRRLNVVVNWFTELKRVGQTN